MFSVYAQHPKKGEKGSCEIQGLAGAREAEEWQRVLGNSRELASEMT